MKFLPASLLFAFITLAAGGCALSPQTVALRPAIDASAKPIGRGRSLALEVIDQRPSQAFGHRGGVYDTAAIVPRTDVSQSVRTALAERLRASGFKIIGASPAATLAMQVTIRRIDYAVNSYAALGGPLLNEVRVHAAMDALVSNAGRSQRGQYQASSVRRQLGFPDAVENEIILNEVVAQMLQQLLQDTNVLQLLAR